MKNILIPIFCIFFSISMFAQQANPVSWDISAEELSDKEYILSFRATIENSWYIYSQHIETRPPIPTSFLFDNTDDFELKGEVQEIGDMIDIFDETFETNIRKFAEEVTFQAIVKTKRDAVDITGKIEYMVCDNQKCLPPEFEKFTFNLVSMKSQQRLVKTRSTAPRETPKEEIISSTPNFEITPAKKYGGGATIPPPDQHIIIAPHKPIDVSKIGEMQSFEEANGLPELPQEDVLNQQKTIILDDSQSMVGSNITAFMDMSFLEDKKAKKTNKTNKQKVKEEKRAIAEAKIDASKTDKQKAKAKPYIDPVKWNFNMVDLKNGTYELVATASIDDNWYIYSKENDGKGPFPATLVFDTNENIEFVDEKIMEEGNLRNDYDRVFDKQVNRYTHQVTFKRNIRFKDNVAVNGTVRYMAANADRYLMPKTKRFAFNQDLTAKVNTASATNVAGWWRWMLAVASIIFLAFVSSQENAQLATNSNKK
ncbi:MAG: protein-disulfide reductase DsbD domain-containing protein [Chitinophagales bacterium]